MFATRLSIGVFIFLIPALAAQVQTLPDNAAKRNWNFAIWVAAATGEENHDSFSEAQIWTAGVHVGRTVLHQVGTSWTKGSIEYGFDLIPILLTSNTQRTLGGGFEPIVVRWNSTHHFRGFTPYVELAGGGVFTRANLPVGNTSNFNFSVRGGGGFYILQRGTQTVDVSCRWWHISNANLGVQNPEFNGIQIGFAYHWLK